MLMYTMDKNSQQILPVRPELAEHRVFLPARPELVKCRVFLLLIRKFPQKDPLKDQRNEIAKEISEYIEYADEKQKKMQGYSQAEANAGMQLHYDEFAKDIKEIIADLRQIKVLVDADEETLPWDEHLKDSLRQRIKKSYHKVFNIHITKNGKALSCNVIANL